MAAADGWLLRLRPRQGRLDAPALRRLATICTDHGNGAVILTRRAKLELRGIRDTEAALADLVDAGLVSADPREEALPDRIVAPATDLDSSAMARVEPVLEALEAALRDHDACTRLPSKFALRVDGGGAAHVRGIAADLCFGAVDADTWRVAVAGVDGDVALGDCASAAVPEVACSLMERFQQLRAGHESRVWRMRHAVHAWGSDRMRDAAAPWLDAGPRRPVPRACEGVLGHQSGRWYGVAFAFGRLAGDTLAGLADIGERYGDGDVRILPTRSVLVSRASAAAGPALRALGGIERGDDPRLHAETCSGRGGCERGTTLTLSDTHALAAAAPRLLGAGTGCVLHVSGCAKGCAYSGRAPVTLTGRDGHYDVSLWATPEGAVLWHGLDRASAAARLAALERLFLRWRGDSEAAETTLARFDPRWLCERIEEEVAGA